MKKTIKIVVVYYGDDWKKDLPMPNSAPTRESFEYWHELGLEHGVEMFRGSIKWYDMKKNVFRKVWAYRDKKWIKIRKPIKPDMLFDKIKGVRDYALFDFKMEISKKVKIFNHPLFRTMFDNKLSQYLIFEEFMPKSFLAIDRKSLKEIVREISSKKVVLKPPYGSGGFGIKIVNKKQALKSRTDFPVFVQQFIKSEKGIPGFSKKDEIADLRMIYTNHKLAYALSRIAKKGSLFTNFHQGATAVLVPERSIPMNTRKMAKKIINKLSIFRDANYSLDFIFTNSGKPILVEMNTTPGFDLLHIVGDEKIKKAYFKGFINVAKYQ